MPALYETVTLKSSKECKSTLEMLKTRKDVCGYIRKLALRPNYYLAWPKRDDDLSEVWVAEMVEIISEDLKMLHTFDWDGLELPKDSLWTTLRSKYVTQVSGRASSGTDFHPVVPNSKACFLTLEPKHSIRIAHYFVSQI
jgi:hypothetical protein